MKLPAEHDQYQHNKYLDKIKCAAILMAQELAPHPTSVTAGGCQNICAANLKYIKMLKADLLHLELALEEILQLREQR